MHADCKRLLKDSKAATPEPSGKERNRAQRHCAIMAYLLMKQFSHFEINGNRNGRFICSASILYEELTGSEPIDMFRPCKTVLRNPPGSMATSPG
jgi:hypothetical protein